MQEKWLEELFRKNNDETVEIPRSIVMEAYKRLGVSGPIGRSRDLKFKVSDLKRAFGLDDKNDKADL